MPDDTPDDDATRIDIDDHSDPWYGDGAGDWYADDWYADDDRVTRIPVTERERPRSGADPTRTPTIVYQLFALSGMAAGGGAALALGGLITDQGFAVGMGLVFLAAGLTGTVVFGGRL